MSEIPNYPGEPVSPTQNRPGGDERPESKGEDKREEKASAEPEKPEELSDEEFAALREQVRKMYDDGGPEETR